MGATGGPAADRHPQTKSRSYVTCRAGAGAKRMYARAELAEARERTHEKLKMRKERLDAAERS